MVPSETEIAMFTPDNLKVGMTAEFERRITEEDVYAFSQNSGDANPLHMEESYARQSNFQRRIVHGAFQVSLTSALLGMRLPGRNALLGSINAKFPHPLYFPCCVRVHGQVVSWNLAAQVGLLKAVVLEVPSQIPTAEIFLGFTFHQNQAEKPLSIAPPNLLKKTDRKVMLVTGASGGIGSALVLELAKHYLVIALVHRRPLPESIQALPTVHALEADLRSPNWEPLLKEVLRDQPLYGIVHCAWPGRPHGSLLQMNRRVIEEQLAFGTWDTIALARLLFSHTAAEGGRLVLLGSVMGSQKPQLTFSSYSLGKASLEHTVRLLAPELARKKITVNVINLTSLPIGMNNHVSEQQKAREVASIPMGRLCQPEDIGGLVRYLLSPETSFISGQVIGLTGAQL